jgi:hypothetical protein
MIKKKATSTNISKFRFPMVASDILSSDNSIAL